MTSHDRVPSSARPLLVPHRLALLLGLVLLAFLSFLPLEPPEPRDASAPAEAFSAMRAMEHVEALAVEPHPAGTPAHGEVLRELVRRIGELGLDAQVQETLGARPLGRDRVRAAWAKNVVTRLEGSAGGDDAVLLVAHYDSGHAGAGAADDAAGVAVLLETLRALQAGTPPRHDVIALFTDAEELGLLGAQGFVDHHPWAEDVRLAVNFEARGAAGPSIMFETGPGTGSLVNRFARETPAPFAASYSYDVYRMLPNNTDFSVFKEAGWPGFNFAFIGDPSRYHTALDTPENLSRASLQHHGESALGLARHFGAADDLASLPKTAPATYFSLPGLGLVTYSGGLAPILGFLVVLIALALLVLGVRRGRLTIRGILGSFLRVLLAVVLGVAGGYLLNWLGRLWVGPSMRFLAKPQIYLLGLALAAAGLTTWLLVRRRRGDTPLTPTADPLGGVVLFWSLLTTLAVLALSSTSYLMLWPLVALVALLAVEVFASGLRLWAWVAVLVVAAIPALWLWPPTLSLIGVALQTGLGPLAISLLVALLATLLFPQLRAMAGPDRGPWLLPATLVVLGLVVLVASLIGHGPTADNPYPTHVVYLLDADTGTAHWATFERVPSPWTRQFVGDAPETEDLAPLTPGGWPPLRVADAPSASLPPLEVVPAGSDADGRRLRFALRSPLGGTLARLEMQADTPITGIRVGEDELDVAQIGEDGVLTLEIAALPSDGLPVEVVLAEPVPLTLDTVDQAFGLPTGSGFPAWEPRPENRMPNPFAPTDVRMVGKRYVLPMEGGATEPPVDEGAADVTPADEPAV